ncbi:MAG: hypothetical protein EBR79_03585 [Proteobacteria bacterium]|nr:hypothetical protein [Pseudomonadota bacterium]NBX86462.1 hypothetical protein [Pseudomonadota bacterium]
MTPYAKKYLRNALFEHSITVLKAGETRTLASGKVIGEGDYYADLRLLTTLPEALKVLSETITEMLPPNTRYLGAVPTGGMTTLGAVGSTVIDFDYDLADTLKLFYIRPEKKGHGEGKQVEGWLGTDGRAVLFEDVATSGGSMVRAIQAARAEVPGCNLTHAICILDREMGAQQALAAIGVELMPIFTATQLGLKKAA